MSQNGDTIKLRAKEIKMETATTNYGPDIVDFLVVIDFSSSRITFYREKKETYDIIKDVGTQTTDEGKIVCWICKNEDLKDYKVCLYSPNTYDRVIFTLKHITSTVTTIITCIIL